MNDWYKTKAIDEASAGTAGRIWRVAIKFQVSAFKFQLQVASVRLNTFPRFLSAQFGVSNEAS